MATTLDDLTNVPDDELDAALDLAYGDHRSPDANTKAEAHLIIMAVLQEQSRRRWNHHG